MLYIYVCVCVVGTGKTANCIFDNHPLLSRTNKQVEMMIENGYLASGAVMIRAIKDISPFEELLVDYEPAEQVLILSSLPTNTS
jgi:hypothetical protein